MNVEHLSAQAHVVSMLFATNNSRRKKAIRIEHYPTHTVITPRAEADKNSERGEISV